MADASGLDQIRMVAEHAVEEATDLRERATALRAEAMKLDIRATVLLAMHHTAAAHVTAGTLEREA